MTFRGCTMALTEKIYNISYRRHIFTPYWLVYNQDAILQITIASLRVSKKFQFNLEEYQHAMLAEM